MILDVRLQQALDALVGDSNIFPNEPLKKHTTFRVGGPCDILITPETVVQLTESIELIQKAQIPYYIIGNGSNILFSDSGFRGIIIKIGEHFSQITVDDEVIVAGAGTMLSRLSKSAYENGLSGLEFAEGIPGTLGGALTMNAGAYGGELKDIVTKVVAINKDGDLENLTSREMGFSYRGNRVNDEGYVFISAVMTLTPKKREEIKAEMDKNRKSRTEKQPTDKFSAGSTFKRPEGGFAAKLIEDSGLKGKRIGGAVVSEKHSGFIVNDGTASASDIYELIHEVTDIVYEKQKIHLEPEVKLIGF